jgi:hypothetical protein
MGANSLIASLLPPCLPSMHLCLPSSWASNHIINQKSPLTTFNTGCRRNQTRGEPKAQKRFINDTIRNDFHRRFLDRYVR